MPTAGYVFAYGSLVLEPDVLPTRALAPRGYVTDLLGARRGWGVAMDNRVDLPGYKRYVRADGSRPAVFVAFLDLVADPHARTNGVCLPVSRERLAALDARERNYERIEVTAMLAAALGPTWAYRGSPAGRERFRRGAEAGSVVISRAYLDGVRAGFARLGAGELRRAASSLDPGGVPVAALTRVDLP